MANRRYTDHLLTQAPGHRRAGGRERGSQPCPKGGGGAAGLAASGLKPKLWQRIVSTCHDFNSGTFELGRRSKQKAVVAAAQ
jgi:hypothetical protein